MSSGFVIAVDGPAASGKGTVAQGLARELALPYLDTGLLYRAVATLSRRVANGISEADAETAARGLDPNVLDDPILRTRAAGEFASQVAAFPRVRAALLDFQRAFADQPSGAVLDGRDIGTVIVPTAAAKLFVTATPEVRAYRRHRQLLDQGEIVTLEDVLVDIRRRDERDSGRAAAPLERARDAALLDTSDLTIFQAAKAARSTVEVARVRWAGRRG